MGSKRAKIKSSGKGLAMIALILGAAGLFMGTFSFIQVQRTKDSGLIVGQWERLNRDTSNPDFNQLYDWLIEVDEMRIMNSEYIAVNQTPPFENTRFHLLKIGWYRIDVITLLVSLTTSAYYGLVFYENSELNIYVDYFRNADINQAINAKCYLYNNGSDYFEINAAALGDSDFGLTSIQAYNQLLITFIG